MTNLKKLYNKFQMWCCNFLESNYSGIQLT